MELKEWNEIAQKLFVLAPSIEYKYDFKPRCNRDGWQASSDEQYRNGEFNIITNAGGYDVEFEVDGELFGAYINDKRPDMFLVEMQEYIEKIRARTAQFTDPIWWRKYSIPTGSGWKEVTRKMVE